MRVKGVANAGNRGARRKHMQKTTGHELIVQKTAIRFGGAKIQGALSAGKKQTGGTAELLKKN